MSTYRLKLLNFPGNYEKGTLPYGPRAFIEIKKSSEAKWQNKSFTVISSECVCPSEFEYEVNELIKELETIKKQANSFFLKDRNNKKTVFSSNKE